MTKKVFIILMAVMFFVGYGNSNVLLAEESSAELKLTDKSERDSFREEAIQSRVSHEIKDKRTSNTKHFLLNDGTYWAQISLNSLHYETEEGIYENIELSLIDEVDINNSHDQVSKEFAKEAKAIAKTNLANKNKDDSNRRLKSSYRALHVPYTTSIPKEYGKGYTVGNVINQVTFIPLNVNRTKGEVDSLHPGKITYENAWNSTDVTLVLDPNGVKEFITLKSPDAPNQFVFELSKAPDDELRFGEMRLLPLWLEDASGEIRAVEAKISKDNGKTLLSIVPDLDGMKYPVTIDPSLTTSPSSDAFVSSASPTSNFGGTTYLMIGTNSTVSQVRQSYLNFNNYEFLQNYIIQSATLNLYQYNYASTTPGSNYNYSYTVSRITADWNESTINWNNRPSYTTANQVSGAFDYPVINWLTTNVTQLLNQAISANQFYGFQIARSYPAVNPTPGYLYYRSQNTTVGNAPYLSVVYSSAEESENNDTRGTADPIMNKQKMQGKISSATDQDYYSFTAPSSKRFYLNVKVPAGKNYDVELLDNVGTSLAVSSNGSGSMEELAFNATQGNTYYIRIYGVGGSNDSANFYYIRLIDGGTKYTYNKKGQLTEQRFDSGLYFKKTQYNYDLNGNMIQKLFSYNEV